MDIRRQQVPRGRCPCFRVVSFLLIGAMAAGGVSIYGGEEGEGVAGRPQGGEGNPRLVELQRRIAGLQERLQEWRRETEERLERWWNERREAMRRRSEMEEAEPLERPLLLEFRLEPGEEAPISLVTASTRFEVETSYEQKEAGTHVRIEGKIEPVKGESGVRFRVRFEAVFEMGSEAEGSHMSCRGAGSTVIALGKPTRLLALGDTELVLTVQSPDAGK